MQIVEVRPPESVQSDPVDAARIAIWRLFQEGYVDEDMATAGLLAVDLGTRRAQRDWSISARRHEAPGVKHAQPANFRH